MRVLAICSHYEHVYVLSVNMYLFEMKTCIYLMGEMQRVFGSNTYVFGVKTRRVLGAK